MRIWLGLMLLSGLAWAQPQSPLLAPTRARLARLSKAPKATNAFPVLQPLLMGPQARLVQAECKGLVDCLSLWPKPESIGDRLRKAPDLTDARARFAVVLNRVEPGLNLPVYYAPPDLKEKEIPNWMGLVDVCAAQDVLGYDEVRQGRIDAGLNLVLRSLATSQHISGNGILIQQMIALKIGNQADETLIQCLQKQKIPLASLRRLHRRLLELRPRPEDLALALDIELLCNVSGLSEMLKPKELEPLTRFYFKWRPALAGLRPTAEWRAAYLQERDRLGASQAYFLGLKDVDNTVLEDHWKDRLTRHSVLMQWLELELQRAEKGSYPSSLTGSGWPDYSAHGPLLYTSNGRDFHLESRSSAWDSNPDRSQRKITLRRFH